MDTLPPPLSLCTGSSTLTPSVPCLPDCDHLPLEEKGYVSGDVPLRETLSVDRPYVNLPIPPAWKCKPFPPSIPLVSSG